MDWLVSLNSNQSKTKTQVDQAEAEHVVSVTDRKNKDRGPRAGGPSRLPVHGAVARTCLVDIEACSEGRLSDRPSVDDQAVGSDVTFWSASLMRMSRGREVRSW